MVPKALKGIENGFCVYISALVKRDLLTPYSMAIFKEIGEYLTPLYCASELVPINGFNRDKMSDTKR